MTESELKLRLQRMDQSVIRFVDSIPKSTSADVRGWQLIRSSTSLAANYSSACIGRSRAEFLSKLGIVEEETDETQFWIEILGESQIVPEDRLATLLREVREITAIVGASRITLKRHLKRYVTLAEHSKAAM